MNRIAAPLLAGLWIFASSNSTMAGVIRHDVADADYLALGNDAAYASAGQVTFTTNSDWASGVLIGQEWMVTAGHIVRSNYLNNTPGNIQFTVGGNTYTADQIVLNPGYVHNQSINGNDIALVHLSSSVTNVTPSGVFHGGDELGEVGTLVGFGRTGNGLVGQQPSSATRRGGTNVIDVTGNTFDGTWSSNVLLMDFDRPGYPSYSTWGSATPTDLEYLAAEKDSGAGLWIDVNGTAALAGIIAFSLSNGDGISFGYGDGTGATRVSAHYSWISSYVPDLVTVPETSTLALVTFGSIVTLLSVRTRRRVVGRR